MRADASMARAPDERIAWATSTPYILTHVFAVVGAILWWPPTLELVLVAVGAYYLRMFGITGGYHRYFAHRGFKTGRVFQFVLALIGSFSSQKGVLWWAGHHRHHHKHSDLPEDIHSPKRGFWWSHHGWILCNKYDETPVDRIKDFAKYPELRFLNQTWLIWPFVFGGLLGLVGGTAWAFWGGVVSTVVLWHGTFTINSLAHVWGSVRYETTDTSRNNFWLSLVTMGEGWHNNHHFYQSTARNGFFWWEVDFTYYILRALSWVGIVWDLRQPPEWVLEGKQRRFQSAVPVAPTPEAFVVPKALVESVEGLAVLRRAADGKARLAERAAEVAQSAAEFTQRVADAAQQGGVQSKLSGAASDAAERGAALAKQASEAATEAASALHTRAAETWAETAAAAARTAADAAARAQASIGDRAVRA